MELPYHNSPLSPRARSINEVDGGNTLQAVFAGPTFTLVLLQVSESSPP